MTMRLSLSDCDAGMLILAWSTPMTMGGVLQKNLESES
jgi:hypothetical protein